MFILLIYIKVLPVLCDVTIYIDIYRIPSKGIQFEEVLLFILLFIWWFISLFTLLFTLLYLQVLPVLCDVSNPREPVYRMWSGKPVNHWYLPGQGPAE